MPIAKDNIGDSPVTVPSELTVNLTGGATGSGSLNAETGAVDIANTIAIAGIDNLQNELDIAQADLMVAGQTVPANTTLRALGNDWYHPTGATAPDPLTDEASLLAAGFIQSKSVALQTIADLRRITGDGPYVLSDGSVWVLTANTGGVDDGILKVIDNSGREFNRVDIDFLHPKLFGADPSLPDNSAALITAMNYAASVGLPLVDKVNTYKCTGLVNPNITNPSHSLHIDLKLDFSDRASGNNTHLFFDGGALGPALPLTADCAIESTSVEIGGTKPIAGRYYRLISDAPGHSAATPLFTKATVVQVSDEYDGVSTTVPLEWEAVTDFAVADNARLRLMPEHARIVVKGSLVGAAADGFADNGVHLRHLTLAKVDMESVKNCNGRLLLDEGGIFGNYRVNFGTGAKFTGIAYGMAFSGSYGCIGSMPICSQIGIAYTAGVLIREGESIPARNIEFKRTLAFGAVRSIIDCHAPTIGVTFGGFNVISSNQLATSDDMAVFTGSQVTVNGDMIAVGSGHRHLVNIQLQGSLDRVGTPDYLHMQNVIGNSDTYTLAINCGENAENVNITYDTLTSSSGSGIIAIAQAGDLNITGRATNIDATGVSARAVLTQQAGVGKVHFMAGHSILTSPFQVVETQGAGSTCYIPSGLVENTLNPTTDEALLAQSNSNITVGPDPILRVIGLAGGAGGGVVNRVSVAAI